MRGEVIAIGDELTTGQRLDTNTRWLAEQLTEAGVDVLYHTTVGDDMQANVLAFSNAIERADVVVATGGLGPTADDLTRESLAAAAGVDLVKDEAVLEKIQQMFASRGRSMPERNILQAMFPRGAEPIPNQHGTAPGVEMRVGRSERLQCVVFALPGVPAEMRPMWQASVLPAVQQLHPAPRVIRHRRLKCFGVGESHLEQMMPELIARDREPLVGITVSRATITLRITTSGENEDECFIAMQPTELEIRERLGELVFGEEDEELPDVVVRMLADKKQTLAACDGASHGLLVRWLSQAHSGRRVFHHGELGAAESIDEPAAAEAARRLREEHQTDFALVLAAATVTNDIKSVVVAIAYDGGEKTKVSTVASHPDIADDLAAKVAMNNLRLHLLK